MFDELREFIRSNIDYKEAGIHIDYYVISGGLREVIGGSTITSYLRDFWGSSFHIDLEAGVIFPKNVMSFTEKTRCLFQINKGLVGRRYKGKPGKVNEYMADHKRPVPFPNMIYVGDGLTDVPCMRILENLHGFSFGVFDPEKLEKEEYRVRSWLLLRRGEVPLYPAGYQQGDRLRTSLEWAVRHICDHIMRPP